jgi:aldehyde dehydrogenase (NAD+)
MQAWKLGPALAAGCTVVMKLAEQTPLSGLRMGELIQEAGFPPGVVNLLAGYGPTAGQALARHMDVDKVAFTGSTEVGHLVMKYAAESNLKRVTLELGGKSPNIVFADADLEAAATSSPMGVFANTGQDCCARSRVLVEQSVYDRFLEMYVEATRAIAVGDPLAEETQVGPMVSAGQRESVERYVAMAREEGGRILCGGDRPRAPGYYLSPTVVDRLPHGSRVVQEEIFGPVACVIPFADEREAIALANGTVYGLSGSIWTRDVGRALRVARAVESGVVGVNTIRSVFQEMPFGGFKQSGFGRDLGMEAMDLYTEVKSVFIDTTPKEAG